MSGSCWALPEPPNVLDGDAWAEWLNTELVRATQTPDERFEAIAGAFATAMLYAYERGEMEAKDAQRWRKVRAMPDHQMEDIFWLHQPMSPEALDAMIDELPAPPGAAATPQGTTSQRREEPSPK